MNRKEKKQIEAAMHAFIKLRQQQMQDIETELSYEQDGELCTIPVIIHQDISFEDKLLFIEHVADMCFIQDEYYPSSKGIAIKIAELEFFTDIKSKINSKDLLAFINCFDIEGFIIENAPNLRKTFRELYSEVETTLTWKKEQLLNSTGVNGLFIKLNALLDKIDSQIGSIESSLDKEQIDKLLEAVTVLVESPDKVVEAVIENERAQNENDIEHEHEVPVGAGEIQNGLNTK